MSRDAARGLLVHAFSRYGEGGVRGWADLARVGRRFAADFAGSPAWPGPAGAAARRALSRSGLSQGPLRLPSLSGEDLAAALAASPDAPWALALDGVRLYLSRRLEDAEARFDRLCAAAPRWPWARVLRAEARLYLGPARRALPDLRRARALKPRWAWPLLLEGRALFSAGDAACLAPLAAAARLAPRMALARGWHGHALASLGRVEEGLSELAAAEALDPGYARAAAWRGLHLLKSGRAREARAALRRSVALDPYYPPARLALLEERVAAGDGPGAARAARELGACCARAQWERNAASVHHLRGERDLSRTLRACAAAARLAPSSPWPRWWLGQTALVAGDLRGAERALSAALARGLPRRERAWALAWRGRARARLGRAAAARRDLDAALARPGGPAWALAWRARLELDAGRPAEALADARAAVAADPDLADAWAVLSDAREREGNLAGALEAVTRASSLQPLWSWAKRRRLALAARLGRWDEAQAALDALGPAAGGLASLRAELTRRRRARASAPWDPGVEERREASGV